MRFGSAVRDSGVTVLLAVLPDARLEHYFEASFAANWQSVFRFALASTNDLEAAEDIAQDAFARLWQHRRQIDWSEPVLPWLFTTARHLATDRFRRLRLRLQTAAPTPNPDDVRDRWLDTQQAFSRLSAQERAAIVLSAIEGYSTEDIAQALGISAGAVRAAISRARSKLEKA